MSKNDLLMDTIRAKRNLADCYQKLSDAVYEFEEKWIKKGVNISANVMWKTKVDLYLVFPDTIPDELSEIIGEFQKEFNVELTEILEEKLVRTSSRSWESISWRYNFQHRDRLNTMVVFNE